MQNLYKHSANFYLFLSSYTSTVNSKKSFSLKESQMNFDTKSGKLKKEFNEENF
jgi:hypothetical protein